MLCGGGYSVSSVIVLCFEPLFKKKNPMVTMYLKYNTTNNVGWRLQPHRDLDKEEKNGYMNRNQHPQLEILKYVVGQMSNNK